MTVQYPLTELQLTVLQRYLADEGRGQFTMDENIEWLRAKFNLRENQQNFVLIREIMEELRERSMILPLTPMQTEYLISKDLDPADFPTRQVFVDWMKATKP